MYILIVSDISIYQYITAVLTLKYLKLAMIYIYMYIEGGNNHDA